LRPENSHAGEERQSHAESFSEWFHAWRYLFWFLALTGFVLLFYAEENWRGARKWEAYKRAMAAHGEQFEAAAFVPPKVPDDENFTMTPALAPLFGFVPGSQRWSDTNAPRLFQSLASRFDAAAGAARSKSATRVNSWVKARTDPGLWAAAFALGTNHSGRDHELLPVTNFSSRDAAARVLEALSDYNPILDELQALVEVRLGQHREDHPCRRVGDDGPLGWRNSVVSDDLLDHPQ